MVRFSTLERIYYININTKRIFDVRVQLWREASETRGFSSSNAELQTSPLQKEEHQLPFITTNSSSKTNIFTHRHVLGSHPKRRPFLPLAFFGSFDWLPSAQLHLIYALAGVFVMPISSSFDYIFNTYISCIMESRYSSFVSYF